MQSASPRFASSMTSSGCQFPLIRERFWPKTVRVEAEDGEAAVPQGAAGERSGSTEKLIKGKAELQACRVVFEWNELLRSGQPSSTEQQSAWQRDMQERVIHSISAGPGSATSRSLPAEGCRHTRLQDGSRLP